jgi:hypothetical protein
VNYPTDYAWAEEHKRTYSRATKVRCISSAYLDLDERKKEIYGKYFRPAGIGVGSFEHWWAKNSVATSKNMIESSLDWTFKAKRKYPLGRFNTEEFPALYVAKEVKTAIDEVMHNLKHRDKPFKYTVFSLFATGDLVDLRPHVFSGRWNMPSDHYECQLIAAHVRTVSGIVGIASPSKRSAGGNCCAIFSRSSVEAGMVVETGTAP